MSFDPANPTPAQKVLIELFLYGMPDASPRDVHDTIVEIREGLPLDSVTFTTLADAEFHEYLCDLKAPHKGCTASYMPNPASPDYCTDCEDDNPSHNMPHHGTHPHDPSITITWEGGGFVGGDPLPYRNVKFITPALPQE